MHYSYVSGRRKGKEKGGMMVRNFAQFFRTKQVQGSHVVAITTGVVGKLVGFNKRRSRINVLKHITT